MTAEEILRMIRDLPEEEKNKVLMGIMKDFNREMGTNPDFRHHAIDAMHKFMEKRWEGEEDTSEFESIMKK